MSRTFPNWRIIKNPLPNNVFRSTEERKKAKEDKLTYTGKVPLVTADQLLNTTEWIDAHMEEFSTPVLFLQGEADRTCNPEFTKEVEKRMSSKDKQLKLYPKLWHGLRNEDEADRKVVLEDMLNWLKTKRDLE